MRAKGWRRKIVLGWIKPEFFGFDATSCRVEVEIEIRVYAEKAKDLHGREVDQVERLSICGNIYHGKELIECGQILDTIERAYREKAFERLKISEETLLRLLGVWEGWHLNDMRPYCIHQKPFVKILEIHCPELLKVENLEKLWQVPELNRCPKCGYKYGTEWRYEPLPEYVKDFLMSLGGA